MIYCGMSAWYMVVCMGGTNWYGSVVYCGMSVWNMVVCMRVLVGMGLWYIVV